MSKVDPDWLSYVFTLSIFNKVTMSKKLAILQWEKCILKLPVYL